MGYGCCKKHGGSTPNHKTHALTEQLNHEVRRQLGLDSWVPIDDPYTALADLAGEMVSLKNILREKVEDLDTLRSSAGEYGEQLDVIMQAYGNAWDRAEKILSNMARLDLIGKIAMLHARIDEITAARIKDAVEHALKQVELSAIQREVVLRELGSRLRDGSK